ncbi:hypothetical protein ES702_07708 [subsurface metagenome]
MLKKRCPLLFDQKDNVVGPCGKDKCEWWIIRYNLCAITLIAINGVKIEGRPEGVS